MPEKKGRRAQHLKPSGGFLCGTGGARADYISVNAQSGSLFLKATNIPVKQDTLIKALRNKTKNKNQ